MNPIKIKPKEIQIFPQNPFAEDTLEREKETNILTQLIQEANPPFVLAIDSPWGTGKTTFLTMWSAVLAKHDIKTLYFNAWENDFSDEPFVAIIGEIGQQTNRNEGENALFDAVKKSARKLLPIARQLFPVFVKIATSGVVDLESISISSIDEFTEKIAQEAIDRHESKRTTLMQFRKLLRKYVDTIANNKLVFIIDELDRCRPTFAIEVLERIKHVFNVENIIFVLALDKKQLGHSLKTIYGAEMDVNGYLRRFIDVEYKLQNPSKDKNISELINKYNIDRMIKDRENKNRFNAANELSDINFLFAEYANKLNITLREQEQCFIILSIVYRTIDLNAPIYAALLVTLIILKVKAPDLYQQYANAYNVNEIVNIAEKVISDIINQNKIFTSNKHVQHYIIIALMTSRLSIKDQRVVNAKYLKMQNSALETEENRSEAGEILSLLTSNPSLGSPYTNGFVVLYPQIEMAEKFSIR